MKPLTLLFMGTPSFALPSLDLLLQGPHRLAAVVTRPDRPRGRGQRLQFSAVKEWALQHGVDVCQPASLGETEFRSRLAEIRPDLIVTAAYGRILPPALLQYPPLGCINLHASLLPAYRGAAPIQRAVMDGAAQTGVTVIAMAPELDAGAIFARESEPVHLTDTAGSLHDRLAAKGACLLVAVIDSLASGTANSVPQDPAGATYAPPLRPDEERLDWSKSALTIYNKIRGMNPWPGAHTTFGGKRLKILRAEPPHAGNACGFSPGAVLETGGETLTVAAADGPIVLLEVQPEGKRPMPAGAFCRGYRITRCERLGSEQ